MTKQDESAPADDVDLDGFEAECRAFFESNYKRRPQAADGFVWGRGPDRVALFDEPDPELEAEHIAATRAWRRGLAEAGLAWPTGPTEFGGRELTGKHQSVLDRMAREYDVPGNSALTVSLGMVAPTILAHGSEGAKRRCLRQLYAGDLIACQLFSEPGAGSDLAGVTTSAVRDGDGWRLNGQKVWTSGAHVSDIGEVLCRTSAGPRHRNLTAFVVDMHSRGVEVRPLRQMTGGAAFNEVFFTDVFVPDDDRLGDVGEGWRVALTTLGNERNAIGGESFGGIGLMNLDRLFALCRQFGCDDDPVVRQELARLVCDMRVGKYLRARSASARKNGQLPGLEGPLSKLGLVNTMQRLSEFVSLVLGPRLTADTGEWGTYAWGSFVTGVPGYRLGGGTDEVIRNVIAERGLGCPKEPPPRDDT